MIRKYAIRIPYTVIIGRMFWDVLGDLLKVVFAGKLKGAIKLIFSENHVVYVDRPLR